MDSYEKNKKRREMMASFEDLRRGYTPPPPKERTAPPVEMPHGKRKDHRVSKELQPVVSILKRKIDSTRQNPSSSSSEWPTIETKVSQGQPQKISYTEKEDTDPVSIIEIKKSSHESNAPSKTPGDQNSTKQPYSSHAEIPNDERKSEPSQSLPNGSLVANSHLNSDSFFATFPTEEKPLQRRDPPQQSETLSSRDPPEQRSSPDRIEKSSSSSSTSSYTDRLQPDLLPQSSNDPRTNHQIDNCSTLFTNTGGDVCLDPDRSKPNSTDAKLSDGVETPEDLLRCEKEEHQLSDQKPGSEVIYTQEVHDTPSNALCNRDMLTLMETPEKEQVDEKRVVEARLNQAMTEIRSIQKVIAVNQALLVQKLTEVEELLVKKEELQMNDTAVSMEAAKEMNLVRGDELNSTGDKCLPEVGESEPTGGGSGIVHSKHENMVQPSTVDEEKRKGNDRDDVKDAAVPPNSFEVENMNKGDEGMFTQNNNAYVVRSSDVFEAVTSDEEFYSCDEMEIPRKCVSATRSDTQTSPSRKAVVIPNVSDTIDLNEIKPDPSNVLDQTYMGSLDDDEIMTSSISEMKDCSISQSSGRGGQSFDENDTDLTPDQEFTPRKEITSLYDSNLYNDDYTTDQHECRVQAKDENASDIVEAAALKIQALFRGGQGRRLVYLQVLQEVEKLERQKASAAVNIKRQNEAAITIQSMYRGWVTREWYKRQLYAVVLIQAHLRRILASRHVSDLFEKKLADQEATREQERKAATVVQTKYRSWTAGNMYRQLLCEAAAKAKAEQGRLEATATRIQVTARVFLAKQQLHQLKASRMRLKSKSATTIQLTARVFLARKHLQQRRTEKRVTQIKSATRIQICARHFLAKEHLNKLKTVRRAQMKAIRKIQLATRSYLARRHFCQLREAQVQLKIKSAVRIQLSVRYFLAHLHLQQLKVAVEEHQTESITKIQSCMRLYIAQKQYTEKLCSAILIQAMARRLIARYDFKETLQAQRKKDGLEAEAAEQARFDVERKAAELARLEAEAAEQVAKETRLEEERRVAAILIQAVFRRWIAQDLYKCQQYAVRLIQAQCRGILARNRVLELLEQQWKQDEEKVLLEKSRLEDEKKAAELVRIHAIQLLEKQQKIEEARMEAEKRAARIQQERNAAAVVIQTRFRCWIASEFYGLTIIAITIIQARFRGILVRAKFKQLKEATTASSTQVENIVHLPLDQFGLDDLWTLQEEAAAFKIQVWYKRWKKCRNSLKDDGDMLNQARLEREVLAGIKAATASMKAAKAKSSWSFGSIASKLSDSIISDKSERSVEQQRRHTPDRNTSRSLTQSSAQTLVDSSEANRIPLAPRLSQSDYILDEKDKAVIVSDPAKSVERLRSWGMKFLSRNTLTPGVNSPKESEECVGNGADMEEMSNASPSKSPTHAKLDRDSVDDSESSHLDEEGQISDFMKRKALDFLLKNDSDGELDDEEEDDPYMKAFNS
jgi:hypothetical protein